MQQKGASPASGLPLLLACLCSLSLLKLSCRIVLLVYRAATGTCGCAGSCGKVMLCVSSNTVLAGPSQTRIWSTVCISLVGLESGFVGRRDQYVLAVSLVEALKPEQFALKEVARKLLLLFILFFRSAQESDPMGLKPLELFVIIK